MAELKVLDVFFALVAAAMGTCLRLPSPMSGSCLALVVVCFLVCRFPDESLAYMPVMMVSWVSFFLGHYRKDLNLKGQIQVKTSEPICGSNNDSILMLLSC